MRRIGGVPQRVRRYDLRQPPSLSALPMIPELGHLCLCLALSAACLQGVVALAGAQRGEAGWIALARPLAAAQFALVAAGYALLSAAFAGNDFSVACVVANSNAALPLGYRLAAVWAGHEGSMLLWVLMLSGWGVAVARWSGALQHAFVARVLGVLGLLGFGLLLFTLATSNPFLRTLPAAAEGHDLNPLLQDLGMTVHPPLLYMGYAGFSVAFAFAVAALIDGRLDAAWARWTRPWTCAAWGFLTAGIAVGSWWAYTELGWGGWWFWDPVENASLMPWLAGTALVHALAVSDRRGGFNAWTLALAIATFSLSLLGIFLVRSGVLASVHAFANDPARGMLILVLLVLVIGSALLLFAWRAPRIGLGRRFAALSRESALLAGTVVLMAICAAVLLGTMYPLILDALGGSRISVGAPYFELVVGLLLLPLGAVTIAGAVLRRGADRARDCGRRLALPLAAGLAVALLGALTGAASPAGIAALGLTGALAAVSLAALLSARRRAHGVAMSLAHLGLALLAFGIAMVKTHELETTVTMGSGDRADLGGYSFTLASLDEDVVGPNYVAARSRIDITQGGRAITTLYPEKRIYTARNSALTEASIHARPLRDLYVAMGEELGGGRWTLRIQVKPFMSWLWAGCALMCAGALAGVAGSRRSRAEDAPAAFAGAAVEKAA